MTISISQVPPALKFNSSVPTRTNFSLNTKVEAAGNAVAKEIISKSVPPALGSKNKPNVSAFPSVSVTKRK